jgi:hypothetical protein
MLYLRNLVPVRDQNGRFTGIYRRNESTLMSVIRFQAMVVPWILLAAFILGQQ